MQRENKVVWGLQRLMWGKIVVGQDGSYTYSDPIPWVGARAIDLTSSGEAVKVYGTTETGIGNIVGNIQSSKTYAGTLETTYIPDDFREYAFNMKRDANGVLIEEAKPVAQPFYLLFGVSNDVKDRRHVLYHCTADLNSIKATLAEDGGTQAPQYETFNLSAEKSPVYGTSYVIADRKTDPTVYDKWFDKIYTPTYKPSVSETAVIIDAGETVDVLVNLNSATSVSISSSTTSVATVSPNSMAEGGNLRITGVEQGEATVTLTFNDADSTVISIPVTIK